MAKTSLSKEEKQLDKLVDTYNKAVNSKGEIQEWTDKYLVSLRDKFRVIARTTRGHWSFDFYESLQNLNKESIKRDLKPATK